MKLKRKQKRKPYIFMNKRRSREIVKLENRERVLNDDTPFFIKESYKAIRTNIIFSLPGEGCKKIAVTSALMGEGKSTTCLNMAITFAETGAKTLIIDADLRRPNVSTLLEQKVTPGLSNVLVGLSKLDDVVRKTSYENLDAVFSGEIPPNPTELLISDQMEKILSKLSESYDYIFIDCPPIKVVTDAAIIAKYVAGIVLVVRQGETTRDDVSEAKKLLEFTGTRLLGTILNGDDKKYGYTKHGGYEKGYYMADDVLKNKEKSK